MVSQCVPVLLLAGCHHVSRYIGGRKPSALWGWLGFRLGSGLGPGIQMPVMVKRGSPGPLVFFLDKEKASA